MSDVWSILDAVRKRHALMHGGFYLLANVMKIATETPFEVAPGVHLRRADEAEAQTLRELMAFVPGQFPFPHRNPYETYIEDGRIHDLPPEKHRYYVAEYTGTSANLTLHSVFEASVLTTSELAMGAGVDVNVAGFRFGYTLGELQRVLGEAWADDNALLELGQPDVEELRDVVTKLAQHKQEDSVGLLPALAQYRQLYHIPKFSPMRFLGYMAIVESLITHKPEKHDPYSALTRQVTQKMLLLGKRSKIKPPYGLLNISDDSAKIDPGKIWSAIYEYRSCLAHGRPGDFAKKLRLLGSAQQALDFLRMATVGVMRQTLEEPDLITDLREV